MAEDNQKLESLKKGLIKSVTNANNRFVEQVRDILNHQAAALSVNPSNMF